MNKIIMLCSIFLFVCFFGLLGISVEAQEERTNVYAAVDYMLVPEGGEELYLQVEQAWKKWHSILRDEGVLKFWGVAKVDRNYGPEADYNYITMRGYTDLDQMVNPVYDRERAVQLRESILTDEDREAYGKTGESRTLIRSDLWTLEDLAIPWSEEPKEEGSKTITVGFMKSKAPGRHMRMERDVFKRIWQKAVQDGHRRNWTLMSSVFPAGSQSPYNVITIHSYPKDVTEYSLPEGWRQENYPKIFPEKSEEEINAIYPEMRELRDFVIAENWTFVLGLDDEPVDPIEVEWKKLEGKWKAPLTDGGYRIKEISKGQEIIHVYNADGEHVYSEKAIMEIEQVNGINFFTVHGWTDLNDPNATPKDRNAYKSIYKIHDGKWYEQMHGILNNRTSPPDRFFVYEKVD